MNYAKMEISGIATLLTGIKGYDSWQIITFSVY